MRRNKMKKKGGEKTRGIIGATLLCQCKQACMYTEEKTACNSIEEKQAANMHACPKEKHVAL